MSGQSRKRSILLVDDNDEDIFLTKRLLQATGVKDPVVTCDCGEAAIAYLEKCIADPASTPLPYVIFCDIKMPGLHGFQVLKWVRAQPALVSVTFVMFTGGDVVAERARAKSLGADYFVVKNPPVETFCEILRKAQA